MFNFSADRWPYEPLVLELRDPFMKETRELGENLIIELISKESEYGELDSALFLPCLIACLEFANLEP